MGRKASGVDIYIISLDTFMLMAILGITLGIIFFLVNPALSARPEMDKPVSINSPISPIELASILSSESEPVNIINSIDEKKSFVQNIRSGKILRLYWQTVETVILMRLKPNEKNGVSDTLDLSGSYAPQDSNFSWVYRINGRQKLNIDQGEILSELSNWENFKHLYEEKAH